MDISRHQIGGENLYVWAVIFIGFVFSIVVGFQIGSHAVTAIIIFVTIALAITWVVVGRRRWWLLMPAAGALGGYFWFGFKLYPHELALLGCFAPLMIARAASAPGMLQHNRPSFPLAMRLLSLYLFLHWFGSNLYNRAHDEAGYGNVTRAYFNALWVILFLFAFRQYGSTKYVPAALRLTYVAGFARVLITIVIYFTNIFAYIPVVNYVLPGSTHAGASDLRASGFALATVATCYFLIHKGFLRKSFHGAIFLGSIVALLFGAGRTVLVLVCLVPVFAVVVYQKFVPGLLSLLAIGSLIFALNANPAVLNNTSYPVQRAASGLLLSQNESERYGRTGASNFWHARLREIGYTKWTQSWSTFFFGTGIRPYDAAALEYIPGKSTLEDLLASSSKVGAYESGWWTVIAVTGLTGLIFYLIVLFYLLRRLIPPLLKNKVRDHTHAFAFMAVFGIIIWIALGWTNGGFPSTELMLGFIAVFALEDERRGQVASPERLPSRRVPFQRSETALAPE
jgi:hypothetical protein